MDVIAQDEDGELHADKEAIPYRRSQVQVMSQRAIHDIDKPRSLSDDSVQDNYGAAVLVQCWCEYSSLSSDTPSQLDSFLQGNSKNYTKPKNSD